MKNLKVEIKNLNCVLGSANDRQFYMDCMLANYKFKDQGNQWAANAVLDCEEFTELYCDFPDFVQKAMTAVAKDNANALL